MAIYLSVDLGTTGCRSILFDSALNQLAESYEEYGLITPKEGYVEQDAELWWKLTLKTAKAVIEKSGADPKEIRGISISSHGLTLVPVDQDLTPLCNAISWLDRRTVKQAELLCSDIGEEKMYSLCGKPIIPDYSLPKLLWLKENEPQIYNKAYKFLMPMDFLIARFTGNCVTDHSMASGTLMYDIKNGVWCDEILHRYNISAEKLPTLKWAGEMAGALLPAVAEILGLSPDCVVAVGAQDQKCAVLGAGLKEKIVTVSLGTAGAVSRYWNIIKTENYSDIRWSSFVEKGSWVTEGVVLTAASSLRWLRDIAFENTSYKEIDRLAANSLEKGSSVLFFPHLEEALGTFYGMSLSTDKGDMALAVMESVAFEIRKLMEQMAVYDEDHTAILFGGASKSDLWCQIVANVINMPVTVPKTVESAGAGAAILASIAAGEFTFDNHPALPSGKTYTPDNSAENYKEKYKKYLETAKALGI